MTACGGNYPLTVEEPANLSRLDRPVFPSLTRLVNEWLETAENDVPDVIQKVIDDVNNWPITPRFSLEETYETGALALYLPVAWDGHSRGESDTPHRFIVMHHPTGLSNRDPFAGWCNEIHLGFEEAGSDQMDRPMLVMVGKVLQHAEGVSVGIVPSVVRLETLDEGLSAAVDTWRNVHDPWVALRRGGRCVDGELGAGGICGGIQTVSIDELPSEMVEDRPEILDAVTDDRGQLNWWQFNDSPHKLVSVVLVLLDVNLIRVSIEIVPDLGVEFGQVMFGPVDLRPDTGGPRPTLRHRHG